LLQLVWPWPFMLQNGIGMIKTLTSVPLHLVTISLSYVNLLVCSFLCHKVHWSNTGVIGVMNLGD
jgi:hypothetical protein